LEAHADIYTKPPVDLTAYAGAITSYKNSIPAALDGSRAAIALKNKLRATAVNVQTTGALCRAELQRQHGHVPVVGFSGTDFHKDADSAGIRCDP
jgi:hypothetical protein